MSLTYSKYLKLDELLALQAVQSDPPQHDETLFIVIHQVYELWFKQLLHEIDKAGRDLAGNHLFGAIATFKRMRMIMKTMVAQLDILETMSPMSFLAFRDRLEAASGFQSPQFRAFEFVLGRKRAEMIDVHAGNEAAVGMLERKLIEPSLVDHFYQFVKHQGIELPADVLDQKVDEATIPSSALQSHILDLYRSRPEIAILLELMTDFDEGLQEWRYRHVKMVERTIGDKPGTGGSPGVEFLRKSLFQPIFPDLWAIRNHL
ncbi:MAG: tryptophan 2,3-dioxygenase family protein [Gemmatimonadota bacterium]